MKSREFLNKVLFPPAFVIVLVSCIGFPLTVCALEMANFPEAISYIVYCLSAYALTLLILNFPRAKRRINELIYGDEIKLVVKIRTFLYEHKYTNMFLTDLDFRAKFSLLTGLIINSAYAVFRMFTGIIFVSSWYFSIGFYYLALGIIKFSLLHNVKLDEKKSDNYDKFIHQYKTTRNCGYFMLMINIAVAGMAIQMIYQNKHYEYKGYIIYISALFAFYTLITAIVSFVKYRKRNNPIITSSKLISLMSAIMAMYTLQTAMLTTFVGENSDNYNRMMNSITGGVVFAAILSAAIFQIIYSRKKIKKLTALSYEASKEGT